MLKQLNTDLNDGKIPLQLDYSLKHQTRDIDWNMVAYQSFYKTFDYALTKYDPKILDYVGYDDVNDTYEKLQNTNPKEQLEQIKKNNLNTEIILEDVNSVQS